VSKYDFYKREGEGFTTNFDQVPYPYKSIGKDPDLSKLSYKESESLRASFDAAIRSSKQGTKNSYSVEAGPRALSAMENLGKQMDDLVKNGKMSVEDGRELFRRVMFSQAQSSRTTVDSIGGMVSVYSDFDGLKGALRAASALGLSPAQTDRILRISESERAIANGESPNSTPFYTFLREVELTLKISGDPIKELSKVESLFKGKEKPVAANKQLPLTGAQKQELTYDKLINTSLFGDVTLQAATIANNTYGIFVGGKGAAARRRLRRKYGLTQYARADYEKAIDKETKVIARNLVADRLKGMKRLFAAKRTTPEIIASFLGDNRFGSTTVDEMTDLLRGVFNVQKDKAAEAAKLVMQDTPYTANGKPMKGYNVPGAAFTEQNRMRAELGIPPRVALDTPAADSLPKTKDTKRIVEVDKDGDVVIMNDLCPGE
jgi:hypothetical protein